MTPSELVQNGMSVEEQGIPVDWKGLCMKVFNSANNRIAELEAKVKELEETKTPE